MKEPIDYLFFDFITSTRPRLSGTTGSGYWKPKTGGFEYTAERLDKERTHKQLSTISSFPAGHNSGSHSVSEQRIAGIDHPLRHHSAYLGAA